MVGSTVGPYRITGALGRGGMGEVWQAQDMRLDRPVALKFLPERSLRDQTAVERFLREARAASALNHPNIVTIYDIGETENGRFIAMELIQGRTLRSLAAGGLPTEKLAEIGGQVARALAAAHAAGIAHRDIKPENIMVRDDGIVKVLDFGLARVTMSAASGADETEVVTDPGMLLGTVRYMSPEQGRGETATTATDIFSLGLILYELLTGQHPFKSDSQIGVLHGILSQDPLAPSRLNSAISPGLEALVLRMMEKDPRLRPQAAEVEAEFARMGGGPVAGQAVPAPARRLTVGRKDQIGQIQAAFDSAAAGRGLLVCVAGEPGIGKTTTVEDFFLGLDARRVPCIIARGRCSERLAGSEAYLPFLEALESLLHTQSGDTVSRILKQVAPTWYVQLAPVSAEDSSIARMLAESKSASQERLKRELAAFLQEISRLWTLVFFFDDVHWADVPTVDLLSFIGSRLETMRVLLVATYRPSEMLLAKHPFLQVKLELQGRGSCQEIPLDFLRREDIETYLALQFPENRFPADLIALLYGKTEGNPLFMANLVRYLKDSGVIVEDRGHWAVAQSLPEVERRLPESVRGMIQKKIDQLSDDDRRLLVTASVQGHEFDSAVVARASEMDPARVEERLEALERIHSFVRLEGERELPDMTLSLRYSFVHVLYQNALYATLAGVRKTSQSAAVAQALLDHYGEQSAEIAADLALLLEAARDFGRAADYFLIAAQNDAALYANQEAIELSRRAIACVEKLKGEARHSRLHQIARELARFNLTLSHFGEAAENFELAEKAAADANHLPDRIEAVCGRANALLLAKRMDECREQCERGFELAREHGSPQMLASVEIVHATERLCSGDFAEAVAHYDRAVPVLREKGLTAAGLMGANFRGALHAWRLEYSQAWQTLDWAMEKEQELGERARILQNLFLQGVTLGHEGRMGEALAIYEESRRLAELNGERFVLARIPNTQGWLYRELLDLEKALQLDLEGGQFAIEIGDNEAAINSHINAGQVYNLLGETGRAFEHLQKAEDLLSRYKWFNWLFNIRLQAEYASHWIARGEPKRAAPHAALSLEITERSLLRKHMGWARKLLGDIALLEDRIEDARVEYDAGLRVFEQYSCPTIEWKLLKARAGLAKSAHDTSLADELAARARKVVEGIADSVREASQREKLLGAQDVREI